MSFERVLNNLLNDRELTDQMMLVCGPRQVGKTFLAKQWLAESGHEALYFNWDDEKTRREFRQNPHFFESQARNQGRGARIVFDEIHKLPNWKTLLKGYYDTFSKDFHFLVTGSARLDLFQRSGDSMLGRYHLFHLYPLNPPEVTKRKISLNLQALEKGLFLPALEKKPIEKNVVESLLAFSGFPFPFLKASKRALNLWHREYRARVIREDMRDLTRISDLTRIEHLFDILPSKISSPLSLNSLREDLNCSHDAIQSILRALERLSVLFCIRPYSLKIQNSLKKEPKVYFFDWTVVEDPGSCFENFMALQLKAWCDYVNDGGWANMGLYYLRDKQKREVDFLVTRNNKPFILIEAKLNQDTGTEKILNYFSSQLGELPSFCVTFKTGIFSKLSKNSWMVSADRFFNLLWDY